MARTTYVKKAQKDQGTCERCGKPIQAGDPYKWVKPKTGPYGGRKRKRCATCPGWQPSELTTSKMATVMAAQEGLTEADDLDTAASEIEDDAEGAEDGEKIECPTCEGTGLTSDARDAIQAGYDLAGEGPSF